MSLPGISRLKNECGIALAACLRELGIDAAFLRHMTTGAGDLRTSLEPTRAAQLSDEPAALAVRLFFCSATPPAEECRSRFGSSLIDALLDAHLLLLNASAEVAFPFQLRIVRGLYLLSDYLAAGESEAVMGAGETTAILYQAARPDQMLDRVLDLGCGAGTLALLLAPQANSALGTDVNPRAVALGSFNAAINGINNVEFRTGSLFEPVQTEQFDLIVSQPPYYPLGFGAPPRVSQTFLHGGPRGDELAARIVKDLPHYLTQTGRAVVFTAWPGSRGIPSDGAIRSLQLTTNRRELMHARQSINIIERAGSAAGWHAIHEVPAEAWGSVQKWRIDQILEAESLLHAPVEQLLRSTLRLPTGAKTFEEGSDLFLRCPPESLVALSHIDAKTWELLKKINRAPNVGACLAPDQLEPVRQALRRGFLQPA